MWPRHAPLLLPTVDRFRNDELRHNGGTFSDETTRLCSRQISVRYSVIQAGLYVTIEITDTGRDMTPASIGGAPAFNWLLSADSGRLIGLP